MNCEDIHFVPILWQKNNYTTKMAYFHLPDDSFTLPNRIIFITFTTIPAKCILFVNFKITLHEKC